MATITPADTEAYENWCQGQGLDPELDYWADYDEAKAESDAEWSEYMEMIRD